MDKTMEKTEITTISTKLTKVQNEMKVPKNLHNSFGNYDYRNAESIFEAVKPLLDKYNLSLTISDEVVAVADRVYIKATATLTDNETLNCIEATAYAREAAVKKGMDESQITGATSSYARKYVLNGLFLLDDSKDADTDEYQNTQKKAVERERKQTPAQPTKKAVPTDSPEDLMKARIALKEYLAKHGIEQGAVIITCGLNEKSTVKDYNDALEYARGLVR